MEQRKANQARKMLNAGQQLSKIICVELQLKSWEEFHWEVNQQVKVEERRPVYGLQ